MKIKLHEATPIQLDWMVAKCEGYECQFDDEVSGPWLVPQEGYLHNEKPLSAFTPSTAWSQGGPIIEREKISMNSDYNGAYPDPWVAETYSGGIQQAGPTPLIAAMRCFCCSKLGDVVDVPEELCQQQSS